MSLFVDKKTFRKRFNICRRCDSFFKPTNSCKECGCFMQLKCRLANVKCPLLKWGKPEDATIRNEE